MIRLKIHGIPPASQIPNPRAAISLLFTNYDSDLYTAQLFSAAFSLRQALGHAPLGFVTFSLERFFGHVLTNLFQ